MPHFLEFVENLEFSQWVKNAPTIWAFPTTLIVHTMGMSIVAGVSAIISLNCVLCCLWMTAGER